ncbi:MAG: CoA pyrophosphatase [Syntrophorhabdaceae bacterium]|nr:CoA pyrophosphatase [Syntrophorhabdaceae bacterium]
MNQRRYAVEPDRTTITLIENKLKGYKARFLDSPKDVCAGVLIPIFENDEGVHILLTKRTDKVKVHKGEISFPGGTCEAKDRDVMDTALRETKEEIGIEEGDVKVIGRLDDMVTLSGFVVSPYVGVIPYPYPFKINTDEVAYIVPFPLHYLLKEEPACEPAEYEGKYETVPSFYFNGERIWGATCRILLRLKKIIKDDRI